MKLFQISTSVWAVLDKEEQIWFNLKGVEKLFSDAILPDPPEQTTWTNLSVEFPLRHQNIFPKETVFIQKDYLNCNSWIEEIKEVYDALKSGKSSFFRPLASNIYTCYYDDEGRVSNFSVFIDSCVWFEAKKIALLLNYKNSNRFVKSISNCISWFHLSNGSKTFPESCMFINEFKLSEFLLKPIRKQTPYKFKIWILQEALPFFHSLYNNANEPPAKRARLESDHLEKTLNEIRSSLQQIKQNNDEIVEFYKQEMKFKTQDFFTQFVEDTYTFSNIPRPYALCVFRLSENEFKTAFTYKEHIEFVLNKIKNEIPHAILIYLKSNLFNTLPFVVKFLITELKKNVPLTKIVKDSMFIDCTIPQLTNALDKIVNELRNM